ncbi:hypothetical protein OESDEN_25082 [Oesophagostomum dentatum]|uniref:Amine oxidase domain-containing protein n=1 Tax=Oesophagostomum dentatum TaxID=61180 RepID=A0A0B1RVT6_OESDE|nr:hypothetical protein OESDEN_25082 [Oesophagostomum dentatum]
MAWVAGAGQPVMDNMSDEEIKLRITRLIRDMKNDQSIPPPSEIVSRSSLRTKLTKNELLLGSYSYMSLAQARARISHSQLAIPIKHNKRLKVLFAGEATHHRLFQTAVGAYLSGRREADRLVDDWGTYKPFPKYNLNWQDLIPTTGYRATNVVAAKNRTRSFDTMVPNHRIVLCESNFAKL